MGKILDSMAVGDPEPEPEVIGEPESGPKVVAELVSPLEEILYSLEAILCVSHVTFNEKIMFCYLNRVSLKSDICPDHQAHSLQPILGYTLMAATVDQPPIWVFTLTVTLRGDS